MDEMELVGKTTTGNLDFNVAAALCYLPLSFLHLVAALVFFVSEPKENRFVRFHAVQSTLIFGTFFGGSMAALLIVMLLLPMLILLLGSMVGALLGAVSEDLGALVAVFTGLVSMVCYLGGAALSIALSLGFLPAMLITGALVISGSPGRWPILGGLAARFA